MDEVHRAFRSGEFEWPLIHSKKHPLFDENDQQWLFLAKRLVGLLQSDVADTRKNKTYIESAKRYMEIESDLREAGGYSNLVVANSYAEYAAGFLLKAVIENRKLEREVNEISLSRQTRKPFSANGFLLLHYEEDEIFQNEREKIGSLKKDLDFMTLGKQVKELFPKLSEVEIPITTTELLDRPMVIRLLVETAATESNWNIFLPGLLEYIHRGGKVEQLNVGDIREFERVMGGSEEKYKFPFFGIRYLSVSGLLGKIRSCQETDVRKQLDQRLLN